MGDDDLKILDETIISICKNVKDENAAADNYAETVKALASLVEARAKLN